MPEQNGSRASLSLIHAQRSHRSLPHGPVTLVIQPEALRVILRLDQGAIHRSAPPYKRYDILQFSHYDVILDLDTRLARQARDEARPRELFPSQLRAEIARQQALGQNPRPLVLILA